MICYFIHYNILFITGLGERQPHKSIKTKHTEGTLYLTSRKNSLGETSSIPSHSPPILTEHRNIRYGSTSSSSSVYTPSWNHGSQKELGHTRPKCKAKGCTNLVYHDTEFGNFDYCGPKCRDDDLLVHYKQKLKADLSKFR